MQTVFFWHGSSSIVAQGYVWIQVVTKARELLCAVFKLYTDSTSKLSSMKFGMIFQMLSRIFRPWLRLGLKKKIILFKFFYLQRISERTDICLDYYYKQGYLIFHAFSWYKSLLTSRWTSFAFQTIAKSIRVNLSFVLRG